MIRPNCPIAVSTDPSPFSTMSEPFQKPNAQCSLNEAMLHSRPLYSKWGKLHFMVSTTSGQAPWMVSRR